MDKYWTGAHTKHKLEYHIVWLPKYRRRVLQGDLKKRIVELFYEACEMNRWWISELNIQEDHIHMLIRIKPRDSVSEVVRRLKGGSSRIVRKEYPELEEFLWGDSFWCDGYFVETVGRVNREVIKKYIKQQKSIPQQG